MASNKQYHPADGTLQTEISPVNSKMQDLAVATNLLASRPGYHEARHGNRRIQFGTGTGWTTSLTGNLTPAEDFNYFIRNNTSDALTSYVAVAMRSSDTARGFTLYTNTTANAPMDLAGWSYTANVNYFTAFYNKKYSVSDRTQVFQASEQTYLLNDFGLFSGDLRAGAPLQKKERITSISLGSTCKYTGTSDWMDPNNAIMVKCVIEEETAYSSTESRRIVWSSTNPIEVTISQIKAAPTVASNSTTYPLVKPSIVIGSGYTFPNTTNYYLRIFRTKQYPYGSVPPTDYFLASQEILITSWPITQALTLNDDGLQEPEYTNPGFGGSTALHLTPPPAGSSIDFKGHRVYGNVFQPASQDFAFTALPANADTATINVYTGTGTLLGSSVITFVNLITGLTASQCNIPANNTTLPGASGATIIDNLIGGVKRWLTTVKQETADVPVRITLKSLMGTPSVGGTDPYYKTDGSGMVVSGSSTVRVKAAATSGVMTDLTRFSPAGGIIAAVRADGTIVRLFSYKYITQLTQGAYPGSTEFGECQSLTDIALTTYSAAAVYFFFIPGQSAKNLPLYMDATYNDSVYLANSLVPGISPLSQIKIAYASSFKMIVDGGDYYVSCKPFYQATNAAGNGLLWTTTKLINMQAYQFCEILNGQSTAQYIKAENTSTGVGGFRIRAIDPQVEYFTVQFSTTGITVPETNGVLTVKASKKQGGLVLSNLSEPETVQLALPGDMIQPLDLVSGEKIVGFSKTFDQVNVLTDSKIYALNVMPGTPGSPAPTVNGIQVIDPSNGCIASGSIQTVDSNTIYLSVRGFQSITGNQVTGISQEIDTDVRAAYVYASTQAYPFSANEIRSFVNSARKFYACYIPGSGTFVYFFDSQRWTKWDITFDEAITDLQGRMTLLKSDYNNTTRTWQYLTTDVFTSGLTQNPVDQFDVYEPLTGATRISSTAGTLTLERIGTTNPATNLENLFYTLTGYINGVSTRDLSGYLYTNSTYYKFTTCSSPQTGRITLVFADTTLNIASINAATDYIVKGVPVTVQFQPHTGAALRLDQPQGASGDLKRYVEWNTHFETPITGQAWTFRTDTSSSWITGKVFSTSYSNQTLYRDFVPVQVSSGRWLERKLTHDYPGEMFRMTGQTIVFAYVANSNASIGGA